MKLKSVLKFGWPALAVAALAISLPLTLTSCSNSSSTLKFDQNLQSSYQIVDLGEDFKLEVQMSSDDNLGYQWYFKDVTALQEINLADDDQSEISVPSSLEGFTAIKGENKSTLTIKKDKFNDLSGHEVEFACAIYNQNDTNDYVVSNITTISVADKVETTKDQINNFVTNSSTLFANKVQFMEDVESNGFVKKGSTTWDIFEKQLGFNSLEKSDESAIKTIQFINVNENTRDVASTETNVVIALNDGYTWSESLATTESDNNFGVNENNELEIRNVTLPFDFEVDKNPQLYFNIDGEGIITGLTEEGKKLQNIVIPNTPEITGIGEFAFSNSNDVDEAPQSNNQNPDNPNTTLQTISIPSNIKSIGKGAFFNCIALTNVIFTKDSQLQSIGEGAFKYNTALKSITIPESVQKIGNKAFRNTGITTLTFLGKDVQDMGDGVFGDCTKLENVTLPSELTKIPFGTFYNTTALKQIDIPNTVERIGTSAFGKSGITTLDLSNTKVTTIANSCFSYTTNLESIQLPKHLEIIEINAFTQSGIKSISIPETVTYISYSPEGKFAGAFTKCTQLTSVTFEGDVSNPAPEVKDLTIGQFTFTGCTSLKSLTFPPRTKLIEANAISSSGVTSVTFQGTVNPQIWANTFAGVSGLTVYVTTDELKTSLQNWFNTHASSLSITVQKIGTQSGGSSQAFFSTFF